MLPFLFENLGVLFLWFSWQKQKLSVLLISVNYCSRSSKTKPCQLLTVLKQRIEMETAVSMDLPCVSQPYEKEKKPGGDNFIIW